MKKVLSCLILITSGLALSGCDTNIRDFVTQVKPQTGLIESPSIDGATADPGKKVSPGHFIGAGSTYSAVMTVTPTKKTVVGTTYSAELSVQHQQ
jgi:hypothetical protein